MLTYNYLIFTPQAHQLLPGGHHFDRICREYGVEHRLTNPAHLWTNSPVERRNRTIKEATVQRFHYQTRQEFNEHLRTFLLAQNHAKQLKTLPPPPRIRLCPVAKQPHYFYQRPGPAHPMTIQLAWHPPRTPQQRLGALGDRGHSVGETGLRSALAFAAKQSLQPSIAPFCWNRGRLIRKNRRCVDLLLVWKASPVLGTTLANTLSSKSMAIAAIRLLF